MQAYFAFLSLTTLMIAQGDCFDRRLRFAGQMRSLGAFLRVVMMGGEDVKSVREICIYRWAEEEDEHTAVNRK